jgi:hypothetical protein
MKFHWMHRFDFGNTESQLIEMSKVLEKSKAYSVLLTYSIFSPDFVPFLPSMIKETKKLKFMMAFRPYTISPEYTIRFFNTMKLNFGDRLTFNMVAGKMLEQEEKAAIEMYNLEESLINTIDKRIEFTDQWANKFFNSMKSKAPISYTIANSPSTLELGNKWTDYIIFHESRLEENYAKAKNTKLVLCIDPLIRENKEDLDSDIEYYYQSWRSNKADRPSVWEKQDHLIRGNMEEVKEQIRDISQKYGVNDFMIVTSQKDISSLLQLMEEMSDW